MPQQTTLPQTTLPQTTLPQPVTPITPAQQASLINLVRRAAKTEILPRFRNLAASQINTKSGPDDLVTEADTMAEAMIARGILRLFPNACVLGEEAAAANPALRDTAARAELAFIIDPVDGTWNFAHGLPLFGVILAATRFGRPVFGLLYDPITDDWIVATPDAATCQSDRSGKTTACATAAGGALAGLSGIAHLSLMPPADQAILAPMAPEFSRLTALRCSCHEYRLLARGALDFVLSGTLNPWDHAAGVLLCQQAGGHAGFLDGRAYDISITDGYLLSACNRATWDRLRDHFAPLIKA